MLGHRELTIDDYLEIVRRRFWILLVLGLAGAACAYLYSRTVPDQYQSHTLVLVQQPKVDQKFVTPVADQQINQRLATMTEQILSAAQLQPVVEQFHVYQKELPGSSPAARAHRLQDAITVTPAQPAVNSPWAGIPGFTIEVILNDPHVAQEVCAKLASLFIEESANWQAQTARDTTEFLSKQIDDAKQALDAQDAKLTAFKLRYLGRLPDQAQTNMDILASFNSQLGAATEALNRTQQNKVYLESQLAQQLASWKATRSGSNLLTLEEQLAAMRNKLVMMRSRYTEDYPDVIKLKGNIAQLQKRVDAANAADQTAASTPSRPDTPAYAEPPQIRQLRQQIHQYDAAIQEATKEQVSLQKKIDEYQGRIQMSPVIDQQFTELTRNYQTALEFYRGLLTKKAQADMGADLQRRQQTEAFRVIDPASFSPVPIAPKRPLYAGGGGAVGICLGLAIALWLELRDKFIRTERDVEFYLQAPTLALVPWADKQTGRTKKHPPSILAGNPSRTIKSLHG
ncbi:MAG TPA: Wzz/FepE/Etk N-terminal domain-containing protein [Patescibacteria group bacterium]|nr:Wzz/FepE/Etk N-terminal domain-containing protein [Patescibacteria group bacterium]